jgi:hypothetical protein
MSLEALKNQTQYGHFNGDKELYVDWRALNFCILRSLPFPTRDDRGGVSWTMSKEQRALKYPGAPAHEPLKKPPSETPSNAAERKRWKEDHQAYDL